MKIDVFSHIAPKKYIEGLQKRAKVELPFYFSNPVNTEIDVRLRVMERYPDVLQVLTVALPSLDTEVVSPDDAIELAKVANDELAELVVKYPNNFAAAVACLPLSDIDASLKEADRAITQLKLRGVQLFTNIGGEPLGTPKFKPLYEMMANIGLPIWIHPSGQPTSSSGNIQGNIISTLGWPFETTVAMGSLVTAEVFKDYPNIKFITHHCGAMVPSFHRRIGSGDRVKLADRINDFRKFYADTALYGNTAGLMCGYAYFGAERLLFATDMPLGWGPEGCTLETIHSIEAMNVPAIDKNKIFYNNAMQLLKLSV